MKWVCTIAIVGFSAAQLFAQTPAGKQSHKTSRTSHSSSAKVKPAVSSSHHLAAAAGKRRSSSTASLRRVSGKSSTRAARPRYGHHSSRIHAEPAPSYQLHPDPERYQEIQKALAERGYFKGEVNGTWGDDSVDALKRFQADQKLPNDGKISALTLIGLGLGPKHNGIPVTLPPTVSASAASNVAVPPPAPVSAPVPDSASPEPPQ